MYEISVILPVYNRSKQLRRCIESILNQTYPSIELIIVDDGSNDGSEKICDEYDKKYENVKVVHKSNGGVSSARNVGLENASGSYIGFVDSDDFIEAEMYRTLISAIGNSDLVMCGYYKNGNACSGVSSKCTVGKEEAISSVIGNGKFKGFLWNKLFRKSIIVENKLSFSPDIYVCEDLLFCVQYIDKINNALLLPEVLYHYEDNVDGSLSNGGFTSKKMTIIDSYNQIACVETIKHSQKTYDEIMWRKIRHCISLWYALRKREREEKRRYLPVLKREIKNGSFQFVLAEGYGVKYKLMFLLIKIF